MKFLEDVSKPQIAFEGKAKADEKAQHTWEYVSILKRLSTQPSSVRWDFEMASKYNRSSEEIRAILENYKTVAIVGLSPKPERDSHKVAKYLKENHYEIVPVNPGQKKILSETCYPNLKAIPFPIDVVDIFRMPDAIPPVVDDAIEIGAKLVWMQLGIVHNQAAEKARKAGLEVIMNKCIKTEHMNMLK